MTRWLVPLALTLVMGFTGMPGASAGVAPATARLVLTSDGTALRWTGGAAVVAERGAARVLLDTSGVAGVRSDVVRLRFAVVGGSALAVTTPSPFGGVEPVATAADGVEGEGYAQVGRSMPLDLTFAEPGQHRVRVTASLPGAAGPLEAAIELAASTEAGAPVVVDRSDRGKGQAWARAMGQAEGPVVISDGHMDMGPRIVDGSWRIQLKDDTVQPAVWRELADVVLHADDEAKAPVPPGDEFAFLGKAGEDVWLLPQAQQAGIVWPGWNTQDPSVLEVATGPVTWRLLGVDGPGSFALFTTGSFGAPEVIFDSDRTVPQQHPVALGTHVHGSWAFSEPGLYRLDVEMSAPTSTGTVSDSRRLAFAVGDVDPQQGFEPGDPGVSPATGGPSGSGGPQQELSTSLGSSAAPSGGPVGAMADTGIHGLVPKVALALVLLGLGALLLRGARNRMI